MQETGRGKYRAWGWDDLQGEAYAVAAILGTGRGPEDDLSPQSVVAHLGGKALVYAEQLVEDDPEASRRQFAEELETNGVFVRDSETGRFALGIIGRVLVADQFAELVRIKQQVMLEKS